MAKIGRAALAGLMVAASLALGAAASAEGDDGLSPLGLWKTIDDATGKAKSIVKVWEKDGVLFGTIVKLIDPEVPDPVCDACEGPLRGKPIVGMTIMRGLRKDGNEYSGGTILDPENGKTYRVLIEVVDGGGRLKVRGYIGISLLGRTQHWVRVK